MLQFLKPESSLESTFYELYKGLELISSMFLGVPCNTLTYQNYQFKLKVLLVSCGFIFIWEGERREGRNTGFFSTRIETSGTLQGLCWIVSRNLYY